MAGQRKRGVRLLEEERNFTVIPGEAAHIIDLTSTLIASQTDLTFAQDNHSFLGVRVADTMDVEDGGTILKRQWSTQRGRGDGAVC